MPHNRLDEEYARGIIVAATNEGPSAFSAKK
jgi:hypothetical protein